MNSNSTDITTKKRKFFALTEQEGDLFKTECTHLAHCISRDCRMGAGIAHTFVQRFGGDAYRQSVIQKQKQVSDVAIVTVDDKTIYNLITKNLYYEKPTIATLIATLMVMRRHAIANGVECIAMPRIACGLDKLPWFRVRQAIEDVFAPTNITIKIIYNNPIVARENKTAKKMKETI